MSEVIYKNLSFKITGLLFQTHRDLGRFRNERQCADYFEKLLKENNFNYIREYRFIDKKNGADEIRCICDFIIDDKIILEFKAKSFITKEDYYQLKRYLITLNKKLAILVNFRQYRLSPKRILNKECTRY